MPMYLESLDNTQSYLADLFVSKDIFEKLEDGKIYNTNELKFDDWLITAGKQHKSPQKKLKAVWYGNL
jgi:hypothetical protein